MNNIAKLGLLTPALLNPATAAVVGIAAIAVGIYRMLPDDDEEEAADAVSKVDAVAVNGSERAIPNAEAPLAAVDLGDFEPVSTRSSEAQQTALVVLEADEAPTLDPDQSEMIRKTMSELGKRSAVARAKKKAERDETE